MQRFPLVIGGALMALVFAVQPTGAQTIGSVRTLRATVVLETPRGDSIPVASIPAGLTLEVLGRQGNWFLVSPPETGERTTDWERGWIHGSAVDAGNVADTATAGSRPAGRLMVRGFGQGGGALFTAHDSFETIVGSHFGLLFGGGGQIVFPNGAFAQISVERFRETGSRALVAGNQVFTSDVPARITVTPVLASVGYRSFAQPRYAPYLAAGVGWHALDEDSPTLTSTQSVSERKLGYHLIGGVEFPFTRWAWLAGEVQWTTVPDALGESGISALFAEDDLGGTTFRFKVILGY